jgi:hypothetical protein
MTATIPGLRFLELFNILIFLIFTAQARGQAIHGSKKRTGRTRQPLFSCKSIEKAFPMLKLNASGSPNAVSDAQMSIQLIRI